MNISSRLPVFARDTSIHKKVTTNRIHSKLILIYLTPPNSNNIPIKQSYFALRYIKIETFLVDPFRYASKMNVVEYWQHRDPALIGNDGINLKWFKAVNSWPRMYKGEESKIKFSRITFLNEKLFPIDATEDSWKNRPLILEF